MARFWVLKLVSMDRCRGVYRRERCRAGEGSIAITFQGGSDAHTHVPNDGRADRAAARCPWLPPAVVRARRAHGVMAEARGAARGAARAGPGPGALRVSDEAQIPRRRSPGRVARARHAR